MDEGCVDGCEEGCNPEADDQGCKSRATHDATHKPLKRNGKTTKVAGLHGLRGFDQEIDRDDQENSRCGACDGFGCPSCKPENFGLPPKRKSQRASTR
jgi:hypothetical protein